jgi:hypothetical protein
MTAQTSGNFNVCLVNIQPDGQVVFADNFDRAFDWLSLDSISFDTAEASTRVEEAPLGVGGESESEGEGGAGSMCAPSTSIPVAFRAKKSPSVCLNQVGFPPGEERECTAVSEVAGYCAQGGMVHLFGQVVAASPPFTVNALLLTLPEPHRPSCCHDFLVCGAGEQGDAAAGGAMLRLHPDGTLLFMGTSQDSAVAGMESLSLDGVRFVVSGHGDEKSSGEPEDSSLEELSLGPDVAMKPTLTDHSRSDESSAAETATVRCPCFGKHGNSDCHGSGGCALGCHIPGKHRPGDSLPGASRPKQSLSVDTDALMEHAALGGYSGCACSHFPCEHVLAAAARGQKQKRAAGGDGKAACEGALDFGKAFALRKSTCGYLCGQVFKRRRTDVPAAAAVEGYWQPGERARIDLSMGVHIYHDTLPALVFVLLRPFLRNYICFVS